MGRSRGVGRRGGRRRRRRCAGLDPLDPFGAWSDCAAGHALLVRPQLSAPAGQGLGADGARAGGRDGGLVNAGRHHGDADDAFEPLSKVAPTMMLAS